MSYVGEVEIRRISSYSPGREAYKEGKGAQDVGGRERTGGV